MSALGETVAGDPANDRLISKLRGENSATKITITRNSPKSNSETTIKNGKTGPLASSKAYKFTWNDLKYSSQSGLSTRFSSKTIGTSEVQATGGTCLKSSSTAETIPSTDYCFEEPNQASSLGKDQTISALQAELDSTLVESRDTFDKLEESRRECKLLRDQVLELQKNLEDAHDFIFSLQRREQNFTESEAAAEFNSLGMIVEDWVQTKLGEAIDKQLAKGKATLHGPTVRKFLSLISQPGREAFNYPDTDEYNVIAAIMKFLCMEIFDKDFYCPIESGAMPFLASIEKSMRNLEPRRDLITWRSWHSETFAAITKRQLFATQRQTHSTKLSTDLAMMLQLFLPRSDQQSLSISVQNTIVEPALQLAHKMHLSVNEFSVQYTSYHRRKSDERQHTLGRVSSPFECVAISPPGKVIKFPVSEGTLTYLFDLSPELVFKVAKTDSYGDSRVLRRARVLVAVTKGEQGSYALPASRLREPPTLLGWMDEMTRQKPPHLGPAGSAFYR